jgi:hypothetical protein
MKNNFFYLSGIAILIILAVGFFSAPTRQPEPPQKEEVLMKASQDAEAVQQEIQDLKKEVELLKSQQETSAIKIDPSSSNNDSADKNSFNPPANSILCNGKYWTGCPTGQKFYCPPSGDAQCVTESVQQEVKSQLPDYCKDPKDTATAEYCLELAGQRLGFPSGWRSSASDGSSTSSSVPSYSPPETPSFSELMRQREICDLVNGVFIDGECH